MMFKKRNKLEESRTSKNTINNRKNTFSYYSNRSSNDNNTRSRIDVFDQDTKKSNKNIKYIPTVIAIGLILISLIYATIVNTANPKIVQLSEESPNILRSNEFYQEGFMSIMQESILSKSKITINTKDLEKKIIDKYPEISKVSINIPIISKRPVIQISPGVPILIVTSNTGSYVVGDNGKVLMNVNDVPQPLKEGLLKIDDTVISVIEPGDTILPRSTIEFISELKHQFALKNIEIQSIELPAIANELHVKTVNTEYRVKFNLQGDAREQVGTYLAILERMSNGSISLPKDYVDVRVEERAYLK